MYGRTLPDGTVLEFGHEGVLYRDSFVMYDKNTQSLWLHVTGEALKGKLKGTQLDFLPSEIATWGAWKAAHPDTKVLLGRKARGMMGTFALQQRKENYGLSVGEGRAVRLYPYSELARKPVWNDSMGETSLLVVYEPDSGRSAAYSRTLGSSTFEFVMLPPPPGGGPAPVLMRDQQTDSIWSGLRGACLQGEFAGQRLRRLTATPWLIVRWKGFFEDGVVAGAMAPAGESGGG